MIYLTFINLILYYLCLISAILKPWFYLRVHLLNFQAELFILFNQKVKIINLKWLTWESNFHDFCLLAIHLNNQVLDQSSFLLWNNYLPCKHLISQQLFDFACHLHFFILIEILFLFLPSLIVFYFLSKLKIMDLVIHLFDRVNFNDHWFFLHY